MSLILKCDQCGETIEDAGTGAGLRQIARKAGWRHFKADGRDTCDECTWEEHHSVGGKLTTCKAKP